MVEQAGIYTVGGTVQTNEQGLYLPRPADSELLDLCRQGEFAYVLTPRQMGKSSLMICTAEALLEEGRQPVIIDLALIDIQLSVEQWYRGLLTPIADQLTLNTSVDEWWQAHAHLGVTQRFTQFLQQVLLGEVSDPVVIFVDEIDTSLSLDFTDDFFVAVRSLYVARANQPELRRLSFVLIGVAMPGDLIRDAQRTPFNIGQRVDLTDFTLGEAMPLATGLGLPPTQAEEALGWVMKWTGGHPYLTQRLCQEMAQVGSTQWSEVEVDCLVTRTFLGAQSEQDNNIQFVQDMLTKRAPEPVAVLKTYRQVRQGKPPVVDEEQSLIKSHLKLSGVVKREGKTLQVRNRIYWRVFDWAWIREHLPESVWQRLKPAMPIIATLLAALMSVTGFAVYANQQRAVAQEALQQAEQQTILAEQEKQEAERQREIVQRQTAEAKRQADEATRQRGIAQRQTSEARKQARIAQEQTQLANQRRDEADQQRRNAEIQTRLAQRQTQIANRQTTIASLREKAARASYLLITPRAVEGMVLAIQATGESREKGVSEVFSTVNNSLLSAVQVVRERNRLSGHQGSANSVALTPGGETIVSGGVDGTVRLWSREGQPIFSGQQGWVRSVALTLDGETIVSGSFDSTVWVWQGWKGWLRAACTQLQNHSVLRDPNSSFDPEVARGAREACERYVWAGGRG